MDWECFRDSQSAAWVLYIIFFSEAHFPTLMEIFVESKLGMFQFAICNSQTRKMCTFKSFREWSFYKYVWIKDNKLFVKVARNRFFWRARRLGANCASFRESLTPKDTLTTNSNKDYDTKSWQKSQKTFPFYNKHTYSFQVFLS